MMMTMLGTSVRCTDSKVALDSVGMVARATASFGNLRTGPKWVLGGCAVVGVVYGVYAMYDRVSGKKYRRELEKGFKEYEVREKKKHEESFRGQVQQHFSFQPKKVEELGYVDKANLYADGVWCGMKRNGWRVGGGVGVVIGCYFGYQRYGLEPIYNLGAKILFRLVSLVSRAPVKNAVRNVNDLATKV